MPLNTLSFVVMVALLQAGTAAPSNDGASSTPFPIPSSSRDAASSSLASSSKTGCPAELRAIVNDLIAEPYAWAGARKEGRGIEVRPRPGGRGADVVPFDGERRRALLAEIAGLQARIGDKEGVRKAKDALLLSPIIDRYQSTLAGMEAGIRADKPVLVRLGIALAAAGDLQGARRIAHASVAADTAGPGGGAGGRDKLLAAIVAAQADAGDFEGARESLTHMGNSPEQSAALSCLALAQARSGDLAGARETAGTIIEAPAKAEAFASMAVPLARAGKAAEARECLAQARAAMNGPFSSLPIGWYAKALTATAIVHALLGDAEAAVKAAEEIDAKPAEAKTLLRRVDALCRVACVFADAKNGDGAKRAIDAALLVPKRRMEFMFGERAKALGLIAVAQHRAGDAAGVEASFGMAAEALKEFTGGDSPLDRMEVARARARIGDAAGARANVEKAFAGGGRSAELLWEAATVYALLGDWPGARAAAQEAKKKLLDEQRRYPESRYPDLVTRAGDLVEAVIPPADFCPPRLAAGPTGLPEPARPVGPTSTNFASL